jgi:hypothetical protein
MYDVVEEFLQDFRYAPMQFQYGEAAMVMLLAKTSQGFAQSMSRGPVDPLQKNPAAAWRIPVRRISSRYYQGWKVRRLAPNIWEVYNESREAFFIELGIHPSSTPRKRPRRIRTHAYIKTLQFAKQTNMAHRILDLSLGARGARMPLISGIPTGRVYSA